MADREYDQQRSEGASMIESKLREFAKHEGIDVVSCVWNKGRPIQERDTHELVASTGPKNQSAEFSDEQLADYPGRVGTEHTEAMIREVVRRLK